jgi:hypothetical protein
MLIRKNIIAGLAMGKKRKKPLYLRAFEKNPQKSD